MLIGSLTFGRRSAWFIGSMVAAICAWLLCGAVLAQAAREDVEKTVRLGGVPTWVAFSPDSRLLATSNAISNTISVRKTAGGSLDPVPGSPFRTPANPLSVSFSPNGKLLAVASGGGGVVTVYQVATDGSLKRAPESPVEGVSGAGQVAFTPDGKVLVALGDGALSFFSVEADGRLDELSGSPHGCGGASFAISPDGKLVACTSEGALNVFQLSITQNRVGLHPLPGMPLATGARRSSSVTFDPEGRLIAVGNELPQVVSMFALLTDATKPIEVKGSPFKNLGENEAEVAAIPSSISFSPNGHRLAATNLSSPIEVGNDWSTVNFYSVGDSLSDLGRLTLIEQGFPTHGTFGPPRDSRIAYSPDGRWFAATTAEGVGNQGWLALFRFGLSSRRHKD